MTLISIKNMPVPAARQTGAATIFVAVMLVVLASMLSLSTSRSVLFAQKDSNNQYWATQAREVAQSGVEYAMAWLKSSYAPGGTLPTWVAASTENCPSGISGRQQWVCLNLVPPTITDSSIIRAHTRTIRLARDIINSPNVTLISVVAENTNNNSLAEVQQKVYISTLGSTPVPTVLGNNPPLVVNGCTKNFTGNPEICPKNAPSTRTCPRGTGTTVGTAILSLKATSADIDTCLPVGHLNINGGSRVAEYNAPETSCNNAAWKKIFGDTTKDQMRAWSDAQNAAGLTNSTTPKRTVYWVDSDRNWNDSLGSATEPVILIFSATACASGCPKVNGGPTIYGTIYLDTQCTGTRSNGWGGATIYGTVAVESDMEKLNSNTVIHHNGNAGVVFPPPLPPTIDSSTTQQVSGAWKDW